MTDPADKPATRWIVYDPEDGWFECDTLTDAEAQLEGTIEHYRDGAENGWNPYAATVALYRLVPVVTTRFDRDDGGADLVRVEHEDAEQARIDALEAQVALWFSEAHKMLDDVGVPGSTLPARVTNLCEAFRARRAQAIRAARERDELAAHVETLRTALVGLRVWEHGRDGAACFCVEGAAGRDHGEECVAAEAVLAAPPADALAAHDRRVRAGALREVEGLMRDEAARQYEIRKRHPEWGTLTQLGRNAERKGRDYEEIADCLAALALAAEQEHSP